MTRDIVFDVDISQPIVPIQLHEPLYYQNNNAHRIVINLTKNSVEYTPASGHTVTGYFVSETEQKTYSLGGSISGSHLYVTLIQACYAVPTRGYILVNLGKIGSGASTTTVLYLAVNVLRSKTDSIVDPGGVIPDIDTLRAYVTTMQNATDEAETARDQANAAATRAETAADSLQDMVDTAVNNTGYPYTASGSSVTIHPVAGSRIDFIAHIDPVQAGSGDPSPSNVRAITAPERATIKRFGANLLNKGVISGTGGAVTQTDTGIKFDVTTAGKYCYAQYAGLTPHLVNGVTYTVSTNVTAVTERARLYLTGINDIPSVYVDATSPGKLSLTFTWDSSKYSTIRFYATFSTSTTASVTFDDIMMVQGEEIADYVPWVDWTSVALPVPSGLYGGVYDSHGTFTPYCHTVLTGAETYYGPNDSAPSTGIVPFVKISAGGDTSGSWYINAVGDIPNASLPNDGGITCTQAWCSHYTYKKGFPTVRVPGECYIANSRAYFCEIDKTHTASAAALKAYVKSQYDAGTPIIVVAPYTPAGAATVITTVDEKTLRAASPEQLNHVWTSTGTLDVSGAMAMTAYTETVRTDARDEALADACYPYDAEDASVAIHPVKDSRIDFVAKFVPVQASGTPSPSSPLPITAPGTVTVTRAGENLIDLSAITSSDCNISLLPTGARITSKTDGNYRAATIVPRGKLLDGVTYTLSAHLKVTSGQSNLCFRTPSGTTGAYKAVVAAGAEKDVSVTYTNNASENRAVDILITDNTGGSGDVTITNLCLTIGSTALTEYRDYDVQSVTVTLPDGVYGGEYDSKTGTVKVTHNCLVLDGVTEGLAFTSKGTASGTFESSNFYGIRTSDGTLFGLGASSWVSATTLAANVTFSHGLPVSANHSDTFGFCGYVSSSSKLQLRLVFPGADVTVAQANTFLQEQYAAGTPCTLVYPLAVPFTVTLSPSTLRATSTTQMNHVWTDNGEIAVSGATDMKWLIDSIKGS